MPNDVSSATHAETQFAPVDDDTHLHWQGVAGRRSFLKGVGLAGVAALPGSALLASTASAKATSRITKGDVAILRFLAAAGEHDDRAVVQAADPDTDEIPSP